MKLIIDISDTLKNIADKEDFKTFSHFMWRTILMDSIKNGTPFDSVIEDIKAEIETLREGEQQIYGKESWNFVGKCLEIIDKHIAERKRGD